MDIGGWIICWCPNVQTSKPEVLQTMQLDDVFSSQIISSEICQWKTFIMGFSTVCIGPGQHGNLLGLAGTPPAILVELPASSPFKKRLVPGTLGIIYFKELFLNHGRSVPSCSFWGVQKYPISEPAKTCKTWKGLYTKSHAQKCGNVNHHQKVIPIDRLA